jgi:hypothetical protein
MNWIKKKLIKWISNGLNTSNKDEVYDYGSKGVRCTTEDNSPRTQPQLNFRIYNAVNGQILEFNHYNRVTDRDENTVYLVDKNEKIGDYVAKCLTLEMMK